MSENSPNSNLNQTDLLELALRLATHPGDLRTQNAQLLPGQLPDPLPVDIPLPEGSRVLGSLISNAESFTLILQTPLSPEQVLTFYRQHMDAAGWQTSDIYQPPRPHRGGFMSSEFRSRGGSETFYKGLLDPALTVSALRSSSPDWDDGNRNRSGPALTVNAFTIRGNVTDARLNLEMNGPFPPGPPPHWRGRRSHNTRNILPAAESPEGAIMQGGSAGNNPSGTYSDTTITTSIDLSTLAVHYKSQLEQAGCAFTEEGQQGPLVWNTWTLKDDDEQWNGFFMILKVTDQEYYLNMRMRRDNGGQGTTEKESS